MRGRAAPEDGRAEREPELSTAPGSFTTSIVGCPAVRPLVVLPTYNEALNIEEVLTKVRAAVPDAEVLVVDDGSPDGTAELAEQLGAELQQIEVLRRPEKAGLGSAYRAGFRIGLERGLDAMVEMDSDLSHDPAALPSLLAAIDDGADLVIGSRYVPGGSIPKWRLHRRLLSRWGNRYAAALLRLGVSDSTGGYRVYRASDAEGDRPRRGPGRRLRVPDRDDLRRRACGGKIVEVPISFSDRLRGTSKMSGRIVVEAMVLVTWWGLRDRVLRPVRRLFTRA